ncbi:MAG: hypothetical protein V4649_12520 [Bacteroidota bacterium]
MRKLLLPVFILAAACLFLGGCIKNTPYVTTINPSMSASIGSYKFVAGATVPATLDSQSFDTTRTLIITGRGSDKRYPTDRIVLTISAYRGVAGTFSIVQGQASATYYHGSVLSPAAGGVVSITRITDNSIIGYFSFNTTDNIAVTNGDFNVGLP